MNLEQANEAARQLSPAQITAQLSALLADGRGVPVLAWLRANEVAWAQSLTSQKLATDHGKLAHAAGSLYALQILIGQLTNLHAKKARKEEEG